MLVAFSFPAENQYCLPTMKFLPILLCLSITGCSSIPSPTERRALADTLAHARGWQAITLPAGTFDLAAYLPATAIKSEKLTVYIEGDGFAWVNGSQPSTDPTPRNPLSLRLALAQPEGNAVYLARPCQYVDAEASACSSRYWTEMRFAPEVITATNLAIDRLKQRFGASQLDLVGYSGGGAVAALAAAQRSDVTSLTTVAGNLDHRAWTSHHQISPLVGSLNPTEQIMALQEIPQWHFVGANDNNITPDLLRSFIARFPEDKRPKLQVVENFNHQCCWTDVWPVLWRKTFSQAAIPPK